MTEWLLLLGALLPALGIVVAIRRWAQELPWGVAVVGLILSFAFVGAGALPGRMPVPLDEPVRGYPYRGVIGHEVQAKNGLTNDTVRQMLPWMQLVRESFAHGELPLWNRYQYAGYPLLANAQAAPFSPFFLITLFVPLPKQLVAMALLKLFAAYLFTVLFLRDEGRSFGAAMVGGVAYAFCVFQTVYLYYPLTAVTALLPALLWSSRRVLTHDGARWTLLATIIAASAIAGGHPESVLHLALATAVLLGIELGTGRITGEKRRVVRLVLAALAAMMLTAVIWLPTWEQVQVSRRIYELSGAHTVTFPFTALWSALNPNGFGHPARGTWSWIFNYSMVAPTYAGLLLLALAIAGSTNSRRSALRIGAAVVFLLAAMNWTILGRLCNQLPLLAITANDRVRFVTIFLLATVAAETLDQPSRRAKVLFVAAATVIGTGAVWVLAHKLGATLTPRDGVGVIALIAFTVVGAALLRRQAITFVALACVTAELFMVNTEFNAVTSGEYYRMHLPIIETLRRLAPEEPFRITGFDWVLTPNAASQYGVEDVRGSDPMAFGPYYAFFRLVEAKDDSDVKRIQNLALPGVAFLNVRYALTEPGFAAPAGWERRYMGADGELWESSSFLRRFYIPRAFEIGSATPERLGAIGSFADQVIVSAATAPEQGSAAIGPIRQNRSGTRFDFSVRAERRVLIASSQPNTPGWQVLLDGKRTGIVTVNGAFLGFEAPAGEHTVIVRYRPRSVALGATSSLAALLLISAICLAYLRGRTLEPHDVSHES